MPENNNNVAYATSDYATFAYGAGNISHAVYFQIDRKINSDKANLFQIDRKIDLDKTNLFQIDRKIETEHDLSAQIDRKINSDKANLFQIDRKIDSGKTNLFQIDRQIRADHELLSQIDRKINTFDEVYFQIDRQISEENSLFSQIDAKIQGVRELLSQVDRKIEGTKDLSFQIDRFIENVEQALPYEIKLGKNFLRILEDNNYSQSAYASLAYAAGRLQYDIGFQIERVGRNQIEIFTQIDRKITVVKNLLFQVDRKISTEKSLGFQVDRANVQDLKFQITIVLYNTKNLRILSEFSNRGITDGLNWTANSQLAGDFAVNNLNTDIVEQVWRSDNKLNGNVLEVDTEIPQGVFVDTLAILNHNMTTSATIVWQASQDPTFSSIPFSAEIQPTEENIYWIAPVLPNVGYRYHRFNISDPTNTQSYIEIGTIIFGSASILQGECFTDEVTKKTIHFADKVPTEGFTNVSNDRALKFAVGLDFRFLKFNKGNYNRLTQVFRRARTSLKCLWIPTPQYPERYAVFGKLTQIPDETHRDLGADNDYISFSLEVDESL